MNKIIVPHDTSGSVLACEEGVRFWGGVNAETGVIQDAHHPQHRQSLASKFVMQKKIESYDLRARQPQARINSHTLIAGELTRQLKPL